MKSHNNIIAISKLTLSDSVIRGEGVFFLGEYTEFSVWSTDRHSDFFQHRLGKLKFFASDGWCISGRNVMKSW